MQLHPLPVELMTHPIPLLEADNSNGARFDAIRLMENIFAVCDLYHSFNEMCKLSDNIHIFWGSSGYHKAVSGKR